MISIAHHFVFFLLKEKLLNEQRSKSIAAEEEQKQQFINGQEGVRSVIKRKASELEDKQSYMSSRSRVIDDTDMKDKIDQLRQVAPWVPQFTPEAKDSLIPPPPRRPSSPMTGQPIRVKDLIPVNMERESSSSKATEGAVRFMCPVSR